MSDQLQQLDVLIVIDGFNSDKLNVDNCSTARFVPSCLGWVSKLSSPNVIVAFANQPSEIAVEFSKKWSSKFKQFQAFYVSNCQSLNDVLREVDFRQILRNDFMLIQNSSAFCSNCLTRQIEKFRNGRRQNKKNVLTLLYYPKLDYGRKLEERRSLIGYIEQSQKLTHFENISKNEPFSISKSAFLLDTIFRTDIAFCGIALCGIEFSGHFAGNYDLLSFDAIISDILSNEEILMQNIHVDFVEDIYTKANDSSLNSSAERKTNDCAGAYSASISSSISLTNLLIGSDSDSPSDDDTVRQEKRTSDQIDCQSNNTHNQSSFVAEVIDSLQGVLEDGFSNGENRVSADLLNKIKLEINASKLAYNIPAEDVPNHLFTAFLRLPGVVDNFSEFTKMYNHWRGLWKMFFKSAKSQSQMLNAIEEKAIDSDRFRRVLPKVLYFLSQDAKALDDCLIVDWYSKLSEKSPLNKEKRLVELVSWLQNAEESSETDEGDGNDDDD